MLERNLILPGSPRYQPKQLQTIFGYDNLFGTLAEVELANLEVLSDIGIIPQDAWQTLQPEIRRQILAIPTTAVDKLEREVTKHDIRAWVQLAQGIIGSKLAPWVHVPLTSYDALDTARSLQFLRAYQQAIKPSLVELVGYFTPIVRDYADQIQIGRTHGQHALPITVGFWLATILHRMVYNWQKMEEASQGLVGKISGAVGAHNAQVGLGFVAKCGEQSYEQRVLGKLGLKPAPISTQILPPEPLSYFLFSCAMMSAAFGQFGQDCRHLMRSEIAEIAEAFSAGQIGSSTMASKRNPITFEQLVGMWLRTKKEFSGLLDNLLSDHQRDLVGSSLARDFPIILINLQVQLNALLRKDKERHIPFIQRIKIDKETCQRNFEASANVILAEPLYIALIMAGFQGDAHEFVNHALTPKAKASGRSLIEEFEEIAEQNDDLRNVLGQIPEEIKELLHHPENYTGNASAKARQIADLVEGVVNQMSTTA